MTSCDEVRTWRRTPRPQASRPVRIPPMPLMTTSPSPTLMNRRSRSRPWDSAGLTPRLANCRTESPSLPLRIPLAGTGGGAGDFEHSVQPASRSCKPRGLIRLLRTAPNEELLRRLAESEGRVQCHRHELMHEEAKAGENPAAPFTLAGRSIWRQGRPDCLR